MVREYDLKAVYKQAFGGYVRLAQNELRALKSGDKLSDVNLTLDIPESKDVEEMLRTGIYQGVSNALGVPIFMPVQLDGKWLPNEPLVELSRRKVIVETEMPGRDGTMKENMGMDDYAVVIRGIATNDRFDIYPVQQVKEIVKLCEKTTAIKAVSPYFEYFGITKLVIRDWRFPAVEGVQNAQPYELRCISDEDSDLVITRSKNDVSI